MRVNVDSSVFTDARFKLVARATGLQWHDVIGKCVHIWMSCYDQRKGTLRKVEGDCLVDHEGFSNALCAEGLAIDRGADMEIRGFKQRAGWLKQAEDSGKKGGRKSGESRRNKAEGYPSTKRSEPLTHPEGSANPLTLTLTHALAHAPDHALALRGSAEGENAQASPAPPKPAPRRKPAKQLPADWQPSDAHGSLARENRVDLAAEAVKFRDWAASKAEVKADWDAAFRNWLRSSRPIPLRGGPAPRDIRYGSAPPSEFVGVAPGEHAL